MKTKILSFKQLTSRIKGFEDVCKKLGEKPEDVLPHKKPKTVRQQVDNDNARLEYVAQYLQQGSPAEDNYYYPVFRKSPSGFGFSNSTCDDWRASADCGSRLWQPSRELSDFFGTVVLEVHERLLTNKYK